MYTSGIYHDIMREKKKNSAKKGKKINTNWTLLLTM